MTAALGRKDEDLLIEEVDLQRMQVFLGVGDLIRRSRPSECFEPVDLVVQTLSVIGLEADDPPDFLYSQWAAMPYSACSCIS